MSLVQIPQVSDGADAVAAQRHARQCANSAQKADRQEAEPRYVKGSMRALKDQYGEDLQEKSKAVAVSKGCPGQYGCIFCGTLAKKLNQIVAHMTQCADAPVSVQPDIAEDVAALSSLPPVSAMKDLYGQDIQSQCQALGMRDGRDDGYGCIFCSHFEYTWGRMMIHLWQCEYVPSSFHRDEVLSYHSKLADSRRKPAW